jgi:hypothetical protein
MEFPVMAVLTIKIGIRAHRLNSKHRKSNFHHFYLSYFKSRSALKSQIEIATSLLSYEVAVRVAATSLLSYEVAVRVAELLNCEPYY